MPTPESYIGLPEDELRERLALAEAACILFGWSAGVPESQGGEAVHQAWSEWYKHVGSDYGSPRAHPDLDERRVHELVTTRRTIRADTTRNIGRLLERSGEARTEL